MDLQLKDKKVLVTGSTAGIGRATAARFAREGAQVWVHGRNPERTAKAAEELRKETGNANIHAVAGDLGTAEGCAKVIAALPDVDVLVNNAGIFEPKAFTDITDADWQRFFETNVMSGVRLSRHYFPQMLARKTGRIIFISSESGLQIPSEMIHYGTTKTAQLAVARGLAELTSKTGVTVNSVLPGPTRSEGVGDFVKALAKERGLTEREMESAFFKEARPASLLQRFATVEEIADVIVFVASPLAAAINGSALRAEGGIVRSIG